MNMSDSVSRFVLLEKSPTSVKVIGIYTYNDAAKKKDELISQMRFNSFSIYGYEIHGPFDVKVKEEIEEIPTINPFVLEPPPPIISSPKLFTKSIKPENPKIIRDEMKLEDIDKFQ